MRQFPALILMTLTTTSIVQAQSNLFENVKRNPQEAQAMCRKFQTLNSQGNSASSKEAIKEISRQRNLNEIDAEILSIYVIGLHCPEVY